MTLSLEELCALRRDLAVAWLCLADDLETWAQCDARMMPLYPQPRCDHWYAPVVKAARVTGERDPRQMDAALDAAIARAEAEAQAAAVAKASAGEVPELLQRLLEVAKAIRKAIERKG